MLLNKGRPHSRVWWFPAISGMIILAAGALLGVIVRTVIPNSGAPIHQVYPYLVGILSILLHLFLVGRLWKQIRALPDETENSR